VTTVFSGSIIPLPLFPDSFQAVLNVLPFRGLMDIPFRLYSGNIPLADFPRELAFQLAWAFGLMLLGRWLLGCGLRRLSSQGG
jgi:ABC-2 type transport system permease protein